MSRFFFSGTEFPQGKKNTTGCRSMRGEVEEFGVVRARALLSGLREFRALAPKSFFGGAGSQIHLTMV